MVEVGWDVDNLAVFFSTDAVCESCCHPDITLTLSGITICAGGTDVNGVHALSFILEGYWELDTGTDIYFIDAFSEEGKTIIRVLRPSGLLYFTRTLTGYYRTATDITNANAPSCDPSFRIGYGGLASWV